MVSFFFVPYVNNWKRNHDFGERASVGCFQSEFLVGPVRLFSEKWWKKRGQTTDENYCFFASPVVYDAGVKFESFIKQFGVEKGNYSPLRTPGNLLEAWSEQIFLIGKINNIDHFCFLSAAKPTDQGEDSVVLVVVVGGLGGTVFGSPM